MALLSAVEQLKKEIKIKEAEIARINQAIQLLNEGKVKTKTTSGRKGHPMSAETIAKIKATQKKRWAAIKKKNPTKK